MATRSVDLEFPECCAHCPHLKPVKASCTHEFRQSLLGEVDTDRPCPVFSETKTAAMRALSDSL